MRKDGGYVKVERLSQIKKQIAKQFPEPADAQKLKLWIECTLGLSGEKAEQYIKLAVEGAGWVLIEGKILSSPSE